MVFRNYVNNFSILLIITLFNIVYSSAGMPPRFTDLLNAEYRRVINTALIDQSEFRDFFNALNFTEGEYAKKRAEGAFTRIPVASRQDVIATVSALPSEMSSYSKADFLRILSMFPSSSYQEIRNLIDQSDMDDNIVPAVLQYGQSLLVQGTLMAAEG